MKTTNIDSRVAAEMLQDDETEAFVLATIALSTLGQDFFDDSPPVVFNELEHKFGCKLAEENETKLNAVLTVFQTDLFTRKLDVFKTIAEAFDDGDIDDSLEDRAQTSATEAFWAVMQAGLLLDRELGPDDFSTSVRSFLERLLDSSSEDVGDDWTDVDLMQKAPWFQRGVVERLRGMCEDLVKLGCDPETVNGFLAERGISPEEEA